MGMEDTEGRGGRRHRQTTVVEPEVEQDLRGVAHGGGGESRPTSPDSPRVVDDPMSRPASVPPCHTLPSARRRTTPLAKIRRKVGQGRWMRRREAQGGAAPRREDLSGLGPCVVSRLALHRRCTHGHHSQASRRPFPYSELDGSEGDPPHPLLRHRRDGGRGHARLQKLRPPLGCRVAPSRCVRSAVVGKKGEGWKW
jgi:hypothetical protein